MSERVPAVTVTSVPLWRIRLARELPRALLLAVALAGLAASARFAIAPPRPSAPVRAYPQAPARDLAAEGFAQLFARRYLTWEADDPEAHQRALASYLGTGMEPGAGLAPPPAGEERVLWTEVVQERTGAPGERVYTVAAQTDTAGLLYLSVSVCEPAATPVVTLPVVVAMMVAAGACWSWPAIPRSWELRRSALAPDPAGAICAKSQTPRCARSWNARCATTSRTPPRSSPPISTPPRACRRRRRP